jgi:ribosomal protein L14E/L6E/L27E
VLLEVGRVCIKKYGRDAGSKAVITEVTKDGFVKVLTSIRYKKERKCNTNHLEFLNDKIDAKNKDLIYKTLGVEKQDKKQ